MTTLKEIVFECKNSNCANTLKRLGKRNRNASDRPVRFSSLVRGQIRYSQISQYLLVDEGQEGLEGIDEIITWHEDDYPANSLINPIKNARYCIVCNKIFNDNKTIEGFL